MATAQESKLYQLFEELGIRYERHEHPPVYTVEEAQVHWDKIPGTHCKNLFLRNNKGNRHFLVILAHNKQVDLRALAEQTGTGKLSFASAKRLENYLGLEAGAVSPFGLINDRNHEVVVFLDRSLRQTDLINFHPNVNTATVTISYADFERFLKHCGNEIAFI